ncbi:MAG TPA: septum formation family protein [Pseudolysinimonas sp.]|nr:septum formation family protein [Pseudolysinimonas sp.]
MIAGRIVGIAGGISGAVLAALVLAGCGPSAPVASPRPSDGTSAFALVPGDCFDEPSTKSVKNIQTVDCDTPHTYEAYSSITLDDGASGEFPGSASVSKAADTGCAADFTGFIGVESTASTLKINYFAPDATSWEQMHDRQVLCLVYDPAGKTTGSLLGSRR